MMKVKVYGAGCRKCQELTERVKLAATSLGLDYAFEKVSDINAITEAGVLFTPALSVDGAVKVSGKVPSVEQLKEILGGGS